MPRLVYPVILSGGTGSRLWPLSRANYPKQFLVLGSAPGEALSLFQETVKRVGGAGFAPPLVIGNDEHRFIIAEQLRAMNVTAERIVLEPVGRNTAPAVATAALILEQVDRDAAMLVLPSDHVIGRRQRFREAVDTGKSAISGGNLVTFSIAPTDPETGYGYIRRGAPLEGVEGCYQVDRFVEKPDAAEAAAMLKEGGYDWNSGMFLFSVRGYLDELERLHPGIVAACRAAVAEAEESPDFLRLGARAFASAESLSVDYAVMEHTDKAVTIPADLGWSDLGSWSALWEISKRDGDGNVLNGDAMAIDTRDSYIHSEGRLVAVVGLEGVVVVASDDAVLVVGMDKSQAVKQAVARLEKAGRGEHLQPPKVHRPWGNYQSIDAGSRFQVKHIMVNPGSKLSLQMHRHRAEHWVVVSGRATVTRGEEIFVLEENQSTFLPVGVRHSLENKEPVPLSIIEVQSGDYLGEDDIVRFEDRYGRTEGENQSPADTLDRQTRG